MSAPLSDNTLALLRRYMASHALFNGLSALQLSLLSNDTKQGLDLLRHHAAYLRALAAVSQCAQCCSQADEWRLLEHWVWLENHRHNGKEPVKLEGKLSGRHMPSWLLLPFLEFQELRNPTGGKLLARIEQAREQVSMHIRFEQPAKQTAWNEEQQARRHLFESRIGQMQAEGLAEVVWQESEIEASITLTYKNHESCNCR